MTGVEVGEGIECPGPTVEVTGQQRADVAGHQRVDPEGPVAPQMRGQHLVGQR
jgi:hypothetical protein